MDIYAVSIVYGEHGTTDIVHEVCDIAFVSEEEAREYGARELQMFDNPVDYQIHRLTVPEVTRVEDIELGAEVEVEEVTNVGG
jgi:hypothetical protein